MSYYLESLKPRSEKITLVTAEAVERLKLFDASGANWSRVVNHFVVGVKDGGTALTSWTFDAKTMTLTILGGVNPKLRNISVTYRFFFSNAPFILPYDLNNGEEVEWQPHISSVGAVGQQLDEDNTGIVLESSSNIKFVNTDGFFDEVYDTLIWENQSVMIYSWFASLEIKEHITLFNGAVESKSFSESSVSFIVKDFVFKLRNSVSLGLFTESDGTILPSILNTPKRRIYGQVDNCRMVSLDATLTGYPVTGAITIVLDSQTMTGVGTFFTKELSVDDDLIFIFDNEEVKFNIQSIESDTSLTVGRKSAINFISVTANLLPKIASRYRNRTWHIAGHKLRSPSTLTTSVVKDNVFLVDSVADFFNGDEITVNGIQAKIRRVSGKYIVTNNVVIPSPSIGSIITKRPVQEINFGKKTLVFGRDYTVTNTTEAKVIIDELAEFNLAPQRELGVSMSVTIGSRSMTTTSVVDFRAILKPRDWIRRNDLASPDWYEILEVKEQEIILRTAFSGFTGSITCLIKNVDYIDERSLMTVDCLGMEHLGKWVKTASDAVEHLVTVDAGFTSVNNTSFDKAKSDCDYVISIVIPETLGQKPPMVRDVITKINESVFGSLYGDTAQNISYSILNATKPELSNVIQDDDILGFSINSKQQIINKSVVKYRPYTDVNSEEDTFFTEEFESEFVDNLVGIENVLEKKLYLYETQEAKTIAQRLVLMNSLSNATVSIKGKLNLANIVVNDKIFLSLDRLYKRLGSGDKRKLGTVTGVKKDSYNCEIMVSDLANIYNRVPSIAPNATPVFTSSNDDDILRWGYISDNDTETPDASSEKSLGANIIG